MKSKKSVRELSPVAKAFNRALAGMSSFCLNGAVHGLNDSGTRTEAITKSTPDSKVVLVGDSEIALSKVTASDIRGAKILGNFFMLPCGGRPSFLEERERDLSAVAEPQVVIVMEGGVVQDVLSSAPIKALVLDYDVEGGERNLVKIPQRDGGAEEAIASLHAVEVNAERVFEIFATI